MKQATSRVPTSSQPQDNPPPDILEFARRTRTIFGDGVRLLRVVTDDGRTWGNPAWDDPITAPLKKDPLRDTSNPNTMPAMRQPRGTSVD